jgi:hypothetical protein
MRNAYKILVGKSKGKRPLGRPRCKWEYYIGMGPGEIGKKLWTGFIHLIN